MLCLRCAQILHTGSGAPLDESLPNLKKFSQGRYWPLKSSELLDLFHLISVTARNYKSGFRIFLGHLGDFVSKAARYSTAVEFWNF